MAEIGRGMYVHYTNKKGAPYEVSFTDGSVRSYAPGNMLLELASEESSFLAKEKVKNMIHLFPDRHRDLSLETLTAGFKWLYGTIEDENLPVVTDLFRSSFNDAIQSLAAQAESRDAFPSIGAFLEACYEDYSATEETFALYFDALTAFNSGVADEKQITLSQKFASFCDPLYLEYTCKLKVRNRRGRCEKEWLNIRSALELLVFEFCQMKKRNKTIKVCANCGRYFIPPKNKSSIYCTFPSPQKPDQTCQKYGPQEKYAQKRNSDPAEKKYRNENSKIRMAAKRARDRGDTFLLDGYELKLQRIKEQRESTKLGSLPKET